MEPLTILIADDESGIRELLKRLLEAEGFNVIATTNGYEALGAAVLKQPDLVILDVMMPGENGYLVSRALREHGNRPQGAASSVPVILLTGRDLRNNPEREDLFLEFSGADRVIYKPFDVTYVLSQVNKLLSCRANATPVSTSSETPTLTWTELALGRLATMVRGGPT